MLKSKQKGARVAQNIYAYIDHGISSWKEIYDRLRIELKVRQTKLHIEPRDWGVLISDNLH